MLGNEAELISPKCEAAPYRAMQEKALQLLPPGPPGPGPVANGWEWQVQRLYSPLAAAGGPANPLHHSNLCLHLPTASSSVRLISLPITPETTRLLG